MNTNPNEQRRTVSTNNNWEQRFGYARLNKAGPNIYIGGTVALTQDGAAYKPHDPAAQTTRCFQIIENALKQINLDRTAIMRSRVFVTDITHAQSIGQAHKAFFGDHQPCLTMLEIKSLIAPEYLVEIECDAWSAK